MILLGTFGLNWHMADPVFLCFFVLFLCVYVFNVGVDAGVGMDVMLAVTSGV